MTNVIIVPLLLNRLLSAEGESEEAWLAEAGLTGLFDDSLTPDQDQVSIILLLCRHSCVVGCVHFEYTT